MVNCHSCDHNHLFTEELKCHLHSLEPISELHLMQFPLIYFVLGLKSCMRTRETQVSEGEESERAEDSIVMEYKAAFLLLFCNTKEAEAQPINYKQTARLKIKAADRRRAAIR